MGIKANTKSKKGKTSTVKAKKTLTSEKGIKKQYLKSRPVCKVNFRLPKEAAPDAKKVTIVGEFNNWDKESTPMKRLRNGDWTVTLELETGREYRYRFLIDGEKWENDWYADRYQPNPFGCDDSVVKV
ncbi:MAG: glycoside hydrolase [Nitrospirae bacterium]|nr:MAG: glycoside hydrolase [Nitrospirota bacterium]